MKIFRSGQEKVLLLATRPLKKINTKIGSLKRKISKLEKRKKVLSEVLTNIK
jgi:hypothetical protein